ncbi:DUF1214 domain-containing protein [Mycobacterium sp. MYCO198283]|uniref:DUF1214 domain-containing protein n=1 Tax=Mycobacterium sp. MYCO198283 TaxID=2883505 RepID=UPI001E334CDC|nr:DUF1214 domain-containing protein [Mycobacterium sp. MYCO198283]MCG5430891.1 DUF1214 domain-containing protein [Mycobacterium sp. MYCO198283]
MARGGTTGYLSREAAQHARDAADFQRAVTAYRFWYPTVSLEGVFAGNRAAGIADNEAMGIAACGPRHTGFTLTSDTPYGYAALDLSDGPMVIDVPAGPFLGVVNDHHHRWVADLGIPGPDGGRGGRYVILPPEHVGQVPAGHHVAQAATHKVLFAAQAMPVGGDLTGALETLRTISIHGLHQVPAVRFVDTSELEIDCSCLRWEADLEFWRVLHDVLDAEPVVGEYLPMYGLLAAVGVAKGRPFKPDTRLARILTQAALTGREQLLSTAFISLRPDRVAWRDRRWEWIGLVADNGNFVTATGMDLEARDRWFAQAVGTSPAMFGRRAGDGSLYWIAVRDADGDYLDGGHTYELTVPLPVPADLFWSVTAYDAATRSQVRTPQDRAALRSLFELRDAGSGSVTLHFGPEPTGPADRWVQTVPGRGWFAYLRVYGPQPAAVDGDWRPGDMQRIRS